MDTKEKKRILSIEILRIVSMVMVTNLHYLSHSGFLHNEFGMLYASSWLLETICLVATDVFVIISAYFLYDKGFNINRVMKIHTRLLVASTIGVLVGIPMCKERISISMISYLFPMLTRKWGFANNYMLFILSFPLLNPFIRNTSRDLYKKVIIVGTLILSIGSFLSSIFEIDYMRLHYGDSFVWFLFIYLITSYIRKFNVVITRKMALLMWWVPLFVQYLSRMLITVTTSIILGEVKFAGALYYGDISIFSLVSAIGMFFVFMSIKTSGSRIMTTLVSNIAPASFGVYLIQEHPMLRDKLWELAFSYCNGFISYIIVWIVIVVMLFFISIILNIISRPFFSLLH